MPVAPVFYGWWVAIAFALMIFLSTGIRFAVGPFLKPMVADLGVDRASFSLVVSVSVLLYGAFMPLVGRLVERLGVRTVTVIGTLVLGGATAATGTLTSLWQLYLVYGVLFGFGLAACGQVVAAAVIARWFNRRAATALSILGAASMAGMSLLVPVAMWLVLAFGWRTTHFIAGGFMIAVLLPLSLWVVRDSPESMGLLPDGDGAGRPAASARPIERTSVATAIGTLSFWQLGGALFTCGFSMSLLASHGVPMLTDHGYAPMLASWALGLLGGSSFGFAFLLGWIADRWGRRPVLAWLYGTRALLFVGLFLVRDQPWTLLALVALGGATMSGTLAMTSALTADIFGRFSVGSVFGTIFLIHQVGGALGSWLGGVLFEATGGYGAAFAVASGMLLAACLLSLGINERFKRAPALSPAAGG
ncbi:MAG TPA: MFS transporter [Terriglobales bacterium]|nr:MFS transporter [Terriglobales bacterium]